MNTITRKRRMTGKEVHENGFRDAFYSMPHNQLKKIREELCALCYWSAGNFRVKMSGIRYFRKDEIEKIEKYFAEKGIDAWTGLPIKKGNPVKGF